MRIVSNTVQGHGEGDIGISLDRVAYLQKIGEATAGALRQAPRRNDIRAQRIVRPLGHLMAIVMFWALLEKIPDWL